MMSNEKQITVKACTCYPHYFDEAVSASLIDFFSCDSYSTINRINETIILKYCYKCLNEKFVSKKPTIVSDSRWIEWHELDKCYKNVAVPSSGCLAQFLRNEKEFFGICNNCVNFALNAT